MDQSRLYDQFTRCTVRLKLPNDQGTGFFVAPGLVLTCAHVVEAAWPDKAVDVHWAERTIPGQIVPEHFRPENFDLALLQVELADHPCVLLREAYTLGDEMLAFGYPLGSPTGDPVTLVSEDWQRDRGASPDQPHLNLKQGQVQPGLSGAPLLNRRTGGVCGVVRLTRDRASDLGGRALPTALVLAQYDFLGGLQNEFHSRDRIWINLLSTVRAADGAASGGPWWNVPYPHNPYFTGRTSLLEQLETTLASGTIAALAGLGGVGKTQTAVEYAYRHRDEYRAVLWVRADPGWVRPDLGTNLVSGYRELAEVLDLPEKNESDSTKVAAAVRRWLGREPGYLLILDNADDPALVRSFLPPTPTGHVLLTSRAHNFDVLRIKELIELPVLTPDEAYEFLIKRKRTGREESLDTAEQDAARTLAEKLGYLPLALEQAAAYMVEHEESFSVYLAAYSRLWLLKVLERNRTVTGEYPETVRTTWKRSFDAVARSSLAWIELLRLSAFFAPLAAFSRLWLLALLDDEHSMTVRTIWKRSFDAVARSSPASIELLRLSAFFAPDAIPYELIVEGASEFGEPLASALTSPPGGNFVLNEILTPLARHSLVHKNAEARTYSVHRLVQAVLLDELTDATCREFAEPAIKALNRTFPDADYANWPRCERLVPHALAVWGWIECFDRSEEPLLVREAAQLLNQAGYYLYLRARYAEAERLHRRALAIWEALGPDNPDTATSLNNLAVVLRLQGRYYGEAEPLLHRALAIRQAALGQDHPDTAISLNNLALLLQAQGRFAEAELRFRQALEIRTRALPPDHPPDIVYTLNDLAGLLRDRGRYGDAEPLFRQALEIREQALGPDHPDTATSLNDLARLLLAKGRFKEAEVERLLLEEARPLLERALKIREAKLGQDHPDTAISLNHLGVLLKAQSLPGEAEPLHRRALKIREARLGPDHPDVAQSLNNLAQSLRAQNLYFGEAEPLYRRALAIREQALRPEHCKTAYICHNLAELLLAKGRFAEAEPLYRRALAIFERCLGPEHPYTVCCRENLAKLLS